MARAGVAGAGAGVIGAGAGVIGAGAGVIGALDQIRTVGWSGRPSRALP